MTFAIKTNATLKALLTLGLVLTLATTGCGRFAGGNGDGGGAGGDGTGGDGTGGDGTGGDGTGGDGSATLSAEVKSAVDSAFAKAQVTTESVTGTLDGFTAADLGTSIGSTGCPSLSFTADNNILAGSLDFGTGCDNEYFPNLVTGSIAMDIDLNELSFAITLVDFGADGATTNGTIQYDFTVEQVARALVGSVNLTHSEEGTLAGDIDMLVRVSQDYIEIRSATLAVNDLAGASANLAMTGLLYHPIANGNFIPESGTITFDAQDADEMVTVTITFTAESPSTGVVLVTAGRVESQEYQLAIVN